MHRLKPFPHPRGENQRGITLLEALVAVVVAALGILGVVGVQMRTLSDTQTSVRRAQAIRLIGDLSERMRTNPNALADLANYVSGYSNFPTPGDCATSPCSHTTLTQYDLGNWKQAVRDNLPLGQANIFLTPGENTNRRLLGVMISWRENERSDAADNYKTAMDAASSAGGADANNACPANRTCQLQYLPIPARCAPYTSAGTTQFFCPGP